MMRFTSAIILGVCGLPLLGHADGPDGSHCARHGQRIELTLTADEFSIPAYDARRGLVLVQPQTELLPGLERQFAVRLRMREPRVLMPLGPTGLFFGLQSGARDLEMVVVGVPASPDCDAEARPNCDEVEVRSVHLKRGDMIISSRRLDRPVEPMVRLQTRVMTKIQVERGDMDPAALAALADRGRQVSEGCLRRALSHTRAIQGAVVVELGTSVLGEPAATRVVVDGLVNPSVTGCLIERARDDEALWTDLGPAARVFLSLYFRGEAIEASDGVDPSDDDSMLPSVADPASGDEGSSGGDASAERGDASDASLASGVNAP